MRKKIKLLGVVTQAEVVPWHLDNFINRCQDDYELYITGNNLVLELPISKNYRSFQKKGPSLNVWQL